MDPRNDRKVLGEGRFLRLIDWNTWEYVERLKASDVVAIVAITPEDCLLLVEQFRPALQRNTIELPAGLVGDTAEVRSEPVEMAAMRELHEETGYQAESIEYLTIGPTSSGLTSETVTIVRARELTRTGDGGGDDSEDIIVHEAPMAGIDEWLEEQARRGVYVDPKIYAGLYFAR